MFEYLKSTRKALTDNTKEFDDDDDTEDVTETAFDMEEDQDIS